MKESIHDDFSKTPVSDSNLRPWWYLLIIEMGVMISIPIFVVGGQLGLGLSFRDLIMASFLGAAILGVIGGLTARLGAISRCSTALIARITFGSKGAGCIAFLLALGMTGWWGVQTEMFANAVVELSKQLFHVSLPQEITIAVGGMAMVTTAALGIKAIGRLSYLAVPLLVTGLIYALVTIFYNDAGSALFHYHPAAESALSIGAGAATVAGGFIVGASMNPDYSRFARNQKHALGYAVSDYALIYPLLLIVCGIIAVTYSNTNIMVHLVPANYSWLIFLMMMFATWAANDCNLYSSSLSLAAILPRWRRSHLAILAGIFGICLAELHVCGHMVSFLTLLGILIAPVSGVFVINALDRTSPVSESELESIVNWRPAQLLAWFAGAFVGFVSTPASALGLGLIKLTTIPTLDSVLAAAAAMFVIRAFSQQRQFEKVETSALQ
jgi:cytosine permease